MDWSEDFSYQYLEKLYLQAKDKFQVRQLREVPESLDGEASVFLRHDIDICLNRMKNLGEWEESLGFRSTYHVMLSSPFYDPRSKEGREILKQMAAWGHEIGLHYDPAVATGGETDVVKSILESCSEMEEIIGQPVKSLSFHRPPPGYLSGPRFVADRVNAYGSDLFKWYLSDSAGRWREGPPHLSLSKPRNKHLQILVHPAWWGEEHLAPKKRMWEFVKEKSEKLGWSIEKTNKILFDHAGVTGEKS